MVLYTIYHNVLSIYCGFAQGKEPIGKSEANDHGTTSKIPKNTLENKCPKCGETVVSGYRFCSKCGYEMEKEEEFKNQIDS